MIVCMIIVILAFVWLGWETRWFTVRLLTGKEIPVDIDNEETPVDSEIYDLKLRPDDSADVQRKPTVMTFEGLSLPEFTGSHTVGCKIESGKNTILLSRKHFIDRLSNALSENIQIGDIVIGKRNLIEALKLQTDDVVSIQYGKSTWSNSNVQDKPSVQISCGRTVMHFFKCAVVQRNKPCEPIPLNFGGCHDTIKSGVQLDIKVFQSALTNVLIFAEREGYRDNIHSVLFESQDNNLNLVACDGYALNRIPVNVNRIGTHKAIVSYESCKKILSLLRTLKPNGAGKSKVYPELFMTICNKNILFKSYANELTVPVSELTYPDYEPLIPTNGSKVEFIASELLQAVKTLNITAKDGSGIIRLEFKDNKITLSSKSYDIGESTVDCDAIVESDGRIAFNATYLIRYLTTCKNARIIGLWKSQHDGMRFTYNNNIFALMPMQVQWEDSNQADTDTDDIDLNELNEQESNELIEV